MPKSKNVRDDSELRRLTDYAALNMAFQLAHSLYRFREKERETAIEIVWESLRGIGVRLTAQREADRHEPEQPTKVRWTTLQWFQILVYYKSEAYEKQQESLSRKSLTQEDMIIRYIKHLILATTRRNSFHITLGLTRLLYDYSTTEAMAIYDLVFQDPDTSTKKADAYYRARKNRLIEELARRFSGLIQIEQDARGRRRFKPQPDSSQFTHLVESCLGRFTPWETSCALPNPLDTWSVVHSLRGSPASQIHALIHPDCFSKVVTALKLDPPEKRLTLPVFLLYENHTDGTTPPEGGEQSASLTELEASSIRGRVGEEERRRRKFTPLSLRILADGREQARLDLMQSSRIRLDIPEETTLIELVGVHQKDELLLATHVLTQDEGDLSRSEPYEYSLVLEGGQRISLLVLPSLQGAGENPSIGVEFLYCKTRAARASMVWLRQFRQWLGEALVLKNWRTASIFSPKIAVAVFVLLLTGLILYIALSSRRPAPPEQMAQQQPTPAAATATPALSASPPAIGRVEPTPSPQKRQPSNAGDATEPGITRAPGERVVKSLSSIERLYIGVSVDEPFGRALRQRLIEKLRSLNRFTVTESQEEAGAALTGITQSESRRRDDSTSLEVEVGSATLELINIEGEVIWSAGKISGTAEEVSAKFADKLLNAIRAEGRRRKP